VAGVVAAGRQPRLVHQPARPRTGLTADLLVALASGLMVMGMVVDAWAHANGRAETFFTPWHAVLYSGFAALMVAIAWPVLRAGGPQRGGATVPVGYGLGLVGLLLFLIGGVGDGVWHTVFGVEVDIEAQFSPTHVCLLIGSLLMFTTPLRAAWRSDDPGPAPGMRAFLPVLLSLTWATLVVQFFFLWVSAFREDGLLPAAGQPASALAAIPAYVDVIQARGLASVLVTNLLLLAPILLVLRRWRPPAGTATVLFGAAALATSVIDQFARAEVVPAALAGGLAADYLIARSAGWPDRARAHRLVACVTPLALWGSFFLVVQLRYGITWPAELWTGSILFAVLGGFMLSVLMLPPPPGPAPADPADPTRLPVAGPPPTG
jgi:hypothetical protein